MASTTTITAIIPNAVKAAQTVGAENVGLLTAMSMDFSKATQQVSRNQKISVPVVPSAGVNKAFTPSLTPSASDDHTVAAVEIEVTDSNFQDWVITDEQQLALETVGADKTFFEQMLAQKMRALRNGAEADACIALKQGASRAHGTAGTTPCSADLSDIQAVRRILEDNGAPKAGRKLVIDGALEDKLLAQGIVQQAMLAGNSDQLRTGIIAQKFGFDISVSAGIALHTAGGMTGFQADATLAAGSTTLTFDGGTVNTTGATAGDIITIGTGGGAGTGTDYDRKYVINTGSTDTSGSIVIGRPGLIVGRVDNDEITIGGSYTPNFAFSPDAFAGIIRPPKYTPSPMASTALITDPITGMTYLLVHIFGYGMSKWELHLAWGFKVVNPEHVALLIG